MPDPTSDFESPVSLHRIPGATSVGPLLSDSPQADDAAMAGLGNGQPAPRRRAKSKRKTPSRWPAWTRDRDWVLIILLALLNVGSAYTTVLGARQILPDGMADVIGFSVQVMLFLMLAGFAVREALFQRWVAITVFAGISIYTSFFTYYQELAKDADEQQQLDGALQTHAAFVSSIYQPARSRIDKMTAEAEGLFDLARLEAERGGTTGVKGYGPKAKAYADEGTEMKRLADGLNADLERLEPHFEYETNGLTPDDVYRKDLEAWQLTPAEWKENVPIPVREDYVDLSASVALLTPYNRIMEGDMPAMTALGLATMVDGLSIFLGTAILVRRRDPAEVLSERIGMIRKSVKMVREAAVGEVEVGPKGGGSDEPHFDDAIGVVHLRIAGRGSDFLTTFYQAIHPETGVLDFSGLQRSPNPTYRIAARMLIDQLRATETPWVIVQNGRWRVPDYAYADLTEWLGEQIRHECEVEAKTGDAPQEDVEPQRTMRLVLPRAA